MSKSTTTTTNKSYDYFNTNSLVTIILCIAYLMVNLITLNGAIDEMGPQWYYLSIVNIVVAVFLFFKNKTYQDSIKAVL
jgi:hypothetical protein